MYIYMHNCKINLIYSLFIWGCRYLFCFTIICCQRFSHLFNFFLKIDEDKNNIHWVYFVVFYLSQDWRSCQFSLLSIPGRRENLPHKKLIVPGESAVVVEPGYGFYSQKFLGNHSLRYGDTLGCDAAEIYQAILFSFFKICVFRDFSLMDVFLTFDNFLIVCLHGYPVYAFQKIVCHCCIAPFFIEQLSSRKDISAVLGIRYAFPIRTYFSDLLPISLYTAALPTPNA